MTDIDLTSLLTGNNLMLLGGSFVLTAVVRALTGSTFDQGWPHRLLPILPILFAVGGALLGVCDGVTTIPSKFMLGLIVGFAAGHGFKVGKLTVLGFGMPEDSVDPTKPAIAVASDSK